MKNILSQRFVLCQVFLENFLNTLQILRLIALSRPENGVRGLLSKGLHYDSSFDGGSIL